MSDPSIAGIALPRSTRRLWFEVMGVLGRGGFGITYLALDCNLDRRVALKEYFPLGLAERAENGHVAPVAEARRDAFRSGLRRFADEARSLARLKHQNVVQVHGLFESEGTAYIALAHEPGRSLAEVIGRGELADGPALLSVAYPLLRAVEHVHSRGFLHMDIKPQNIIVRADGSPVLIDFGGARITLAAETDGMQRVISDGYAPIEQYRWKDDAGGPWTDVYALGATLHAAVTGKRPPDAPARAAAVGRGEPDPLVPALRAGAGRYPAKLLAAIDAALALEPGQRPGSVEAWRTDFPLPMRRERDRAGRLVDSSGGEWAVDPAIAAGLMSEDENRIQVAALKIPEHARDNYHAWLLDRLHGRDPEQQMAAMAALRGLGHPELEERLLRLAGEGRKSVRRLAVFYLGELRSAIALPTISALMSDRTAEVRAEAREAHRKITEG